jgi:hypothetical protein
MWFALQAYKLTISAEETMVREERAVQGGRRYLEDLQSSGFFRVDMDVENRHS